MIWIDNLILGFLVLTVLLGLWHGLVYELTMLTIWIAAFATAIKLTPWLVAQYLTVKLSTLTTDPHVLSILGFGIIFIAIVLMGMMVNFFISHQLSFLTLGLGNRFLAGIIGFIRGSLMVSVLLLGSEKLHLDTDELPTKLVPYFMPISHFIADTVQTYAIPQPTTSAEPTAIMGNELEH